jgi:hypothetical protein
VSWGLVGLSEGGRRDELEPRRARGRGRGPIVRRRPLAAPARGPRHPRGRGPLLGRGDAAAPGGAVPRDRRGAVPRWPAALGRNILLRDVLMGVFFFVYSENPRAATRDNLLRAARRRISGYWGLLHQFLTYPRAAAPHSTTQFPLRVAPQDSCSSTCGISGRARPGKMYDSRLFCLFLFF